MTTCCLEVQLCRACSAGASVSKQDSDAARGTGTPGRTERSLLSHLFELIPLSLSAFSCPVFFGAFFQDAGCVPARMLREP